MHIEFKIGIDKSDSLGVPNFEPEEVDLWLNKGQQRFVIQRMYGSNPKGQSFEETEKRSNDLRELIVNDELYPLPFDSSVNKPDSIFVDLSGTTSTYWFAVNEEANVFYQDCNIKTISNGSLKSSSFYFVKFGSVKIADSINLFTGVVTYKNYGVGEFFATLSDPIGEALGQTSATIANYIDNNVTPLSPSVIESASKKRVEVKPMQHDDYNKVIKDPFNKPTNDQVRRMFYQDKVELVTDGTFKINSYHLRYIKEPIDISLLSSVNCELARHTHREIVDLSVSMALENIESKRYQTNLAEIVKQE